MEQVLNIISENKMTFIIFAVVCVLSFIINMANYKKRKQRSAGLLEEHPDAAKVYLTSKAFITSEAVTVSLVNGQEPHFFYEGTKTGFYAAPGIVEAEITYTYSRPGVTAKTVTKTYGPVVKRLELEPYGQYFMGFDKDEETFIFEKYTD